jgi:hypothetical protein
MLKTQSQKKLDNNRQGELFCSVRVTLVKLQFSMLLWISGFNIKNKILNTGNSTQNYSLGKKVQDLITENLE